AAAQRLVQRLAVDALHDQVAHLAAVIDRAGAVVVDVDDPRVAQRRHGPGLVAEAGLETRILHQGGQQDLDRDLPAEDDVLGAPHLAHAAAAETPHEAVAPVEKRARSEQGSIPPLHEARLISRAGYHRARGFCDALRKPAAAG